MTDTPLADRGRQDAADHRCAVREARRIAAETEDVMRDFREDALAAVRRVADGYAVRLSGLDVLQRVKVTDDGVVRWPHENSRRAFIEAIEEDVKDALDDCERHLSPQTRRWLRGDYDE